MSLRNRLQHPLVRSGLDEPLLPCKLSAVAGNAHGTDWIHVLDCTGNHLVATNRKGLEDNPLDIFIDASTTEPGSCPPFWEDA